MIITQLYRFILMIKNELLLVKKVLVVEKYHVDKKMP